MKLSEHPYTMTSIVFLLMVFIGSVFFHWQEDYFAFLLILYFIVTLGIRLDDISKQIGVRHGRASHISDDDESIANQLSQIRVSLASIEQSLRKIADKPEHIFPHNKGEE